MDADTSRGPIDGVLAAALYLILERRGRGLDEETALPATTALGALARHLTESDPAHYQPANINHGLFTPLEPLPQKGERRAAYARRAARDLAAWRERCAI